MKVWILVAGLNHQGYEVEGVFSSKELAEAAKTKLICADWHDILEYEVILEKKEGSPFVDNFPRVHKPVTLTKEDTP